MLWPALNVFVANATHDIASSLNLHVLSLHLSGVCKLNIRAPESIAECVDCAGGVVQREVDYFRIVFSEIDDFIGRGLLWWKQRVPNAVGVQHCLVMALDGSHESARESGVRSAALLVVAKVGVDVGN